MTKEKFMRYERLRQSGIINMLDVTSGAKLSGLSKADYVDIIKNYRQYHDRFMNASH